MGAPKAHDDDRSGVNSPPPTRVSSAPPDPERHWERQHIWELRPVQDLVVLLTLAAALWLAWMLRAVTVPALLAWLLAYMFDPVVTHAKERWGFPRVLTTSVCLVLVVSTVVATFVWLVPRVVQDGMALARTLPLHMQHASEWLESSPLAGLAEGLQESSRGDARALFDGALDLAGAVAGLVGSAAYGLASGLLGLATFAYLSVRFPRLPSATDWIPRSHREAWVALLARFEAAVGGFIRGQVIVAIFTTAGFIGGFSLVGVPHAPLAGVIGGALSFVPNGQLAGLLMAWLFGVLDAAMGAELETLPVFLYPAIVYAITQSLETFVITPLVQGSQTRLHPLLVLGALIAGGALGGLLGIFLAIPVTACAKILLTQVVLPELHRYVDRI